MRILMALYNRGRILTRRVARTCRVGARRLGQHEAMTISAALSFRTMFALIPTLVLAFLVMKSAGALDASAALTTLLEKSGLASIALPDESAPPPQDPESGQATTRTSQPATAAAATRPTAADTVRDLVQSVEQKLTLGRVGPVGLALLIWSAVALLSTVERSLNRIFGAPQTRPLAKRVLLYWGVVTLLPIFLAVADYLSRAALDWLGAVSALGWLMAVLTVAGPVLVALVLLTAVYVFMPNCRVALYAAVCGAAVAVPLWVAARWGFSVYLDLILENGSLYGALGLIPLFLIWLYVSWGLFLFGAEVAHLVANPSWTPSDEGQAGIAYDPWNLLAAAAAVAGAAAAGRGPVTARQLGRRLRLPETAQDGLLERLAAAGIICRVAGEGPRAYLPARPAGKIRVLEVLSAGTADVDPLDDPRWDSDINRTILAARQWIGSAGGGLSLADVMTPDRQGHDSEGGGGDS